MTWNDCIALGPTKLAAILGCPVTTAHTWIRRSGPPDWQKAHFILAVERHLEREKPASTPRRKPAKRGRS